MPLNAAQRLLPRPAPDVIGRFMFHGSPGRVHMRSQDQTFRSDDKEKATETRDAAIGRCAVSAERFPCTLGRSEDSDNLCGQEVTSIVPSFGYLQSGRESGKMTPPSKP